MSCLWQAASSELKRTQLQVPHECKSFRAPTFFFHPVLSIYLKVTNLARLNLRGETRASEAAFRRPHHLTSASSDRHAGAGSDGREAIVRADQGLSGDERTDGRSVGRERRRLSGSDSHGTKKARRAHAGRPVQESRPAENEEGDQHLLDHFPAHSLRPAFWLAARNQLSFPRQAGIQGEASRIPAVRFAR